MAEKVLMGFRPRAAGLHPSAEIGGSYLLHGL